MPELARRIRQGIQRHPITWLATACREALDRGDFADSRILLCRVAHGTLAAGDARCS